MLGWTSDVWIGIGCLGPHAVAMAGEEATGYLYRVLRAALQACMQRDSTNAMVNANLSEAELHNIRATPTFVIGPTRPDGKHRGEVVEGAMPWPQFKALIEQQLKALNTP